ncbi:hypothetical protein [Chryseobacterium polytrichastri]|uniref:Uncharacterized protein n=1 Tax=Chryseobacterium polytrichastri TaxID=1302687 RepID=A0A1M6QVZ7_9FLAO|nr:hypothetical protein [Chryseobacterium polytrichastri]SHK24293.1 hypothetical protein SAMN05444267_1002108 [Chryseobacterium polytrichastri]
MSFLFLTLFTHTYYHLHTSDSELDITIFFFGFILVSLYILYLIIIKISEVTKAKDREKINEKRIQLLLKSGMKMEIDLIDSVVSILERKDIGESELSSTINIFIPVNLLKEAFTYQTKALTTTVKLKYQIENKKYFKEITLPYSQETVIIYFKLQKTTNIYYDRSDPKNSVIDLNFIK